MQMLKDFPSFYKATDSTHPTRSSQQDNGQGEIIQRRIRTIQSQRRLSAPDELRHAGNTDHLLTGSYSLDCRRTRRQSDFSPSSQVDEVMSTIGRIQSVFISI